MSKRPLNSQVCSCHVAISSGLTILRLSLEMLCLDRKRASQNLRYPDFLIQRDHDAVGPQSDAPLGTHDFEFLPVETLDEVYEKEQATMHDQPSNGI